MSPAASAKLAETLRSLMAERGLTQQALADQIGESRAVVANLCSGRISDPSVDRLARLCVALKVPAYAFDPRLDADTSVRTEQVVRDLLRAVKNIASGS